VVQLHDQAQEEAIWHRSLQGEAFYLPAKATRGRFFFFQKCPWHEFRSEVLRPRRACLIKGIKLIVGYNLCICMMSICYILWWRGPGAPRRRARGAQHFRPAQRLRGRSRETRRKSAVGAGRIPEAVVEGRRRDRGEAQISSGQKSPCRRQREFPNDAEEVILEE